jgi:superfamily II DNA or RNA helicase
VEGEAEKAMTTSHIVGNVVKTWVEKWGRDKTFMFCVNRSHARKMQKKFEDAGNMREIVFRKYRSGEIRILASIDTVGIGVDEDVRCIIYLRLTKSEMKWTQDGGRGIRLAEGKESCLLLDHAGTAAELGLFTDIHHDERNPDEKGEPFADRKAPKPNKCPKCNALIRRGLNLCPMCGSIIGHTRTPRAVDGDLVAIGKKKRLERSEEQAFYSGLLDFAQRRGFKEGWAANKFRERFGAWPNGLNRVPMTPRKAVREFIAESGRKWREQKRGASQ